MMQEKWRVPQAAVNANQKNNSMETQIGKNVFNSAPFYRDSRIGSDAQGENLVASQAGYQQHHNKKVPQIFGDNLCKCATFASRNGDKCSNQADHKLPHTDTMLKDQEGKQTGN